jgi:hypothetical protein
MQRRPRPFLRKRESISQRLVEASRDEGVKQRVAFANARDGRSYVYVEQ